MSYELLKDNIESLLVEKQYKVAKVEELAGLKPGNLSNILSGRSKKPSAETLVSIANVFRVTVEDLLKDKTISHTESLNPEKSLSLTESLTKKGLRLFSDTVVYIINQIESKKIDTHRQELLHIINEVYEYSSTNSEDEVDKKFVDWYLKQKFNL